jgi:hypothetical protein
MRHLAQLVRLSLWRADAFLSFAHPKWANAAAVASAFPSPRLSSPSPPPPHVLLGERF